MSIKKHLRELLTEKIDTPIYEYGCVMLYLDVPKKDWGNITDVIDKDDLYLGKPSEIGRGRYGIETDVHVTILYGLHDDVPDADVEEIIDTIHKPKIQLKTISYFENELFDVLKYDVESAELRELNKKFAKLPHTTDHPHYHPHATIAYVKKGKAKKYLKILNNMSALDVEPDKIVYSKPSDNGKAKKTYKLK